MGRDVSKEEQEVWALAAYVIGQVVYSFPEES